MHTIKDIYENTLDIVQAEKIRLGYITHTSGVSLHDFTLYLCSYIKKHFLYMEALCNK